MTAEPPRFKHAVRLGLSVLVIWHLVAVVAPPLAFQTRGPMGSSPSVGTMLTPVQAYGQMLYVDRGYAFFAPDPGPSHLIQAAITDPTGQRNEIIIPDREVHWPRLTYHRHFMLAEFLTEIHTPPGPPEEMLEEDPVGARFWLAARARYEYVRQSIIDHLRDENPGQDVAIRRIEHLIPSFQDSIELTDPQLYTVLLDRPIISDVEMELPSGPPEAIPVPKGNEPANTVTDQPSESGSENGAPESSESEPDKAKDVAADGNQRGNDSDDVQPEAPDNDSPEPSAGDTDAAESSEQVEASS